MKPTFCAICTDDRLKLVQRHIGPGDAPVWICTDCDAAPPRADDGPDRGYEAPEPGPAIGQLKQAFARGANRVCRAAPTRGGMTLPRPMTPGFLLVCVPRYLDGRPIDAREARATLRGQPWFAELKVLGSVARFHLFERPDDRAAARARSEPPADPIAGLEQWRVR